MMRKDTREFLRRLAEGWCPMYLQVTTIAKRSERQGWVRIDWGTKDKDNKLCVFLTDAGREKAQEGTK
jgi:hypothetical protein